MYLQVGSRQLKMLHTSRMSRISQRECARQHCGSDIQKFSIKLHAEYLTWPAQVVVLQKLQGMTLHCIMSGGTSPEHRDALAARPSSSMQTVVRFWTPPPQV